MKTGDCRWKTKLKIIGGKHFCFCDFWPSGYTDDSNLIRHIKEKHEPQEIFKAGVRIDESAQGHQDQN